MFSSRVMTSRFCIIFAVLYCTAILIFTVYLRNADNRTYYKLCKANIGQTRLKQQLWQKQLKVEQKTNPTEIFRRLNTDDSRNQKR